tara:strand:+ start:2109 stop:2339 length:231 start_codon:yes stop_codon:yes gene_type:complete
LKKNKNQNIEFNLKKIDTIVEEMELDNTKLDKIMELYKEGIDLIKQCELQINTAEKEIKLLINRNGDLEDVEVDLN